MAISSKQAESGDTVDAPAGDTEAKDRAERPNPARASLEPYRNKRSPERTLEPFGAQAAERPRVFVVQKHRATRLHYDLRLEMGGTLKSWAVPKEPSFDPAIKRMAMHVEDHPVEYADFEGVIPKGNYGAGAMIVWDRGTWVPLEDPDAGLIKGKLLFELKGYKLRGVWTLVKIKGANDWLLIKHADAYSTEEGTKVLPQESILSGLTVEELQEGKSPVREICADIERLGGVKKKVRAADQRVMLAEIKSEPFTRAGWIFELKYDGYRLLTAKESGEPRLYYRRGSDSTKTFPDIARALKRLPYEHLVIDGEVVVLDEEARPSFQRLQKRVQLIRPNDIERAAVEYPATLYVFDILAFEGYDLRSMPLIDRKQVLKRVLPKTGPLRYSDHIEERGEALYQQVEKLKLEGIVAKRADSTYRGGRWDDWYKIRADQTDDFVVVGYTLPKDGGVGFGALHLALYEGALLVYAGRAGSGFSAKELSEIRIALDRTRRPSPLCQGPLPKGAEHVWVEPTLVCEVRFKEHTEEGLLRQPVFLRFRPDKAPAECIRARRGRVEAETEAEAEAAAPPPAEGGDGSGVVAEAEPPKPPSSDPPRVEDREDRRDAPSSRDRAPAAPRRPPRPPRPSGGERKVPFTNLDKVFWPADGYTKGDLIEYYRSVSEYILPYLSDRPVVLTRFPDGIDGKSFFQKDAPPHTPGWLRTERMWSESASREIDYFMCDDVETLLYVINMGSIPLHVWSSRMESIQHPDWCIIDLDPKKAPFSSVIEIARAIRALCDEMELESFIKTSGSTGLHVLLPLGGRCTYAQSRSLGQLISCVIVEQLPEIATTIRAVEARGDRVYLDYLQNGHGRLLVSALCVRPLPGAPVSTPLRWSEVNGRLDPKAFTIQTVPKRLARMKSDPVLPVITARPNLALALQRLSARLERPR